MPLTRDGSLRRSARLGSCSEGWDATASSLGRGPRSAGAVIDRSVAVGEPDGVRWRDRVESGQAGEPGIRCRVVERRLGSTDPPLEVDGELLEAGHEVERVAVGHAML